MGDLLGRPRERVSYLAYPNLFGTKSLEKKKMSDITGSTIWSMLFRYSDTVHQFNRILLYMLKYKEYHQKSPQYDLLLKKNEQMYALLAICLSLCPQNNLIDENVSIELKGKYGTQMTKMLRCDGEKYYDELFSFACPKFIAASPSVFYNQDTYRLQLKLFLAEVKQQQLLLGVRSFLKLFSVITIGKLAQHMGSNETSLREILMAYTHKTHAVDNDGHIISNADFDFYIDEDTIHVTEPKSIKHHNDYFLKHILKFEEVIGELAQLQGY
ncbi:hypothetical protein ACQ4PT_004370 [Festuca glaucescens]